MRILLAMACLLSSTLAGAQNLPGNPATGKELALRKCSNCHVVSSTQTRPATDGVPTFDQLARDPATSLSSLRLFLQAPHRPMPDPMLTRSEIDDLASYIVGLSRQ